MIAEMNDQQIDDLLNEALVGRIGCAAGGEAYVVPVTYVYDGESLYGHSADGKKVRLMRQNPTVCFEVDQFDDLSHWRSVIAWGQFEELSGAEAEAAMERLVARLRPLMAQASTRPDHDIVPGSVPAGSVQRVSARESDADRPKPHAPTTGQAPQHAVLYRIRLTSKSGRYEKP